MAPMKAELKLVEDVMRPDGSFAEPENITPRKAKEWLKKMVKNRPASKSHIEYLAREMMKGNWKNSGETIKFNKSGKLFDGQHRLHAVVKSGCTVKMFVARDLDDDVMMVIDSGRKRTAGDTLAIIGEKYGNNLAAAVRFMFVLATGRNDYRASTGDIKAFVDAHPEIRDSVTTINCKAIVGLPYALLAALHFITVKAMNDPETAEAWANVWNRGIPAFEGDPAQLWREKVIQMRLQGHRPTPNKALIGTIHAYNLFRKRIPTVNFRLPNDVTVEGFYPDVLEGFEGLPQQVFDNVEVKRRKAITGGVPVDKAAAWSKL